MRNEHQVIGSIEHIYPEELKGNYPSQRVIIEIPNRNMNDLVEFKAQDQQLMNVLKQFKKHDRVRLVYKLTGREYVNKNTGEKAYYTFAELLQIYKHIN
jgi:translation initiation factor IF-3